MISQIAHNPLLPNVYAAAAARSEAPQQAQNAPSSANSGAVEDRVTLSPTAQALGKVPVMDFGGKPITLELFAGGFEEISADLNERLGNLFRDNGIQTPPEVELVVGRDGHLRVDGDHPRKDEIEALVNDPATGIRNLQVRLSHLATMMTLMEAHEANKHLLETQGGKAYHAAMQSAVSQVKGSGFGLRYGGGELDFFLQRADGTQRAYDPPASASAA